MVGRADQIGRARWSNVPGERLRITGKPRPVAKIIFRKRRASMRNDLGIPPFMVHRTLPSRFRPLLAAIILVGLGGGNLCSRADASPRKGLAAAETCRLSLLRGLIEQRTGLARAGKTAELPACDAQIKSHPAPPDGDSAALARRLAGTWRSPRHDYLYRADGSWTMLPAERDTVHGRWHIAGNRLEITSGYGKEQTTENYTVIMIDDDDFVYVDRETVFFEKRFSR